ncbi:TetR family transcriptional regulator [Frankia sp. Cas4]|uniref:TetR family transcriptional regulator n=1 Tax=Frankia sp. Cas4 TaxID=3073927 RepID=UPI002AD441A6|nr:TetR family transcriptional regulator [Frankia sp. Cas4]
MREQIAAAALVMFDDQGFEETTVDQIAAAVDISPRSFFRYFPAKEDVVLGDPMVYVEPVLARLTDALRSLPVWEAVRAGFAPLDAMTAADPAGSLRALRVMLSTPALRARNTEKHLAWMTVLVPIVTGALPGPAEGKEFRARAVVMCSLTCLDVCVAEWVHRGGSVPFTQLLDDIFALLKPAVLA